MSSVIPIPVFQRSLTPLHIAMYCFPKDQPAVAPTNCSLVALQLLRLITPIRSNALITTYPTGINMDVVPKYIQTTFGINVRYVDVFDSINNVLNGTFDNYLLPEFATLIVITNHGFTVRHFVILAKGSRGLMMIDPQIGQIFFQVDGSMERFIQQYNIELFAYLRYPDERISHTEHQLNDAHMDTIIAQSSVQTFLERGKFADTRPLIPPIPEAEMTAGKKSKRTRSSRSAYLTR